MIIGVTGFLASGKGVFSNILKQKGFIVYSCSDEIREECKKRNIELTRDNLQKIGNDLREKYGSNILAKRLVERIKQIGLDKNFVIESIRTPAEIQELKSLPNFVLVFIDADSKTRYERAKQRLREKEHISSYGEFLESERKEMESGDPNSQQLLKCKELSNFTIDNNGTLEDLINQINLFLYSLQQNI